MAGYAVITNNPMINDLISGNHHEFKLRLCNDLDEVVVTTRNMIHSGHSLISHPLAGSVKPVENPYRTIILSEGTGPLDYESLRIIEHAIGQVEVFRQSYGSAIYSESLLHDYQSIDYSLTDTAINSLTTGK